MEIDIQKLKNIQKKLAEKVVLKDIDLRKIRFLGACDVSYRKDLAIGVIVVYDKLNRKFIYERKICKKINFPYIPTFLSFREAPLILELYRNLEIKPQVLFIDGQGILHPEKIGLASHVGVLLDIVTVGIAKSRLVGELRKEPEEGEFVPIYHKGKISGYCYCVKKRKKFLWISPGNLITPYKALKLSIKLIKGGKHILLYRADKLSKRF